jgi:hypothetical protein
MWLHWIWLCCRLRIYLLLWEGFLVNRNRCFLNCEWRIIIIYIWIYVYVGMCYGYICIGWFWIKYVNKYRVINGWKCKDFQVVQCFLGRSFLEHWYCIFCCGALRRKGLSCIIGIRFCSFFHRLSISFFGRGFLFGSIL